MTETTVSSTAAPAKQPSFWEDVIDIFFQPADVFRRREHKSVWPPMLFVAITIGVITYATFNTLLPAFEAEFTRNMSKATSANPNVTPEMVAKMRDTGLAVTRYSLGVIILVTMFILGVATWLVSKMFGAKTTFHAALVVAAWAYMPRVLGSVLGGVQGLLMDPAKITGPFAVSIGPARFFDPDATNPLLFQLLGRLDLMTIWVTILLAIGVYVTGRITKEKAAVFGIVIWLLGGAWAFRTAYMAM